MTKKDTCVFCDIVAGKAEAYKVFEDEKSLCILESTPTPRAIAGRLQEACALVARPRGG